MAAADSVVVEHRGILGGGLAVHPLVVDRDRLTNQLFCGLGGQMTYLVAEAHSDARVRPEAMLGDSHPSEIGS